jgi:hypothetical protein
VAIIDRIIMTFRSFGVEAVNNLLFLAISAIAAIQIVLFDLVKTAISAIAAVQIVVFDLIKTDCIV